MMDPRNAFVAHQGPNGGARLSFDAESMWPASRLSNGDRSKAHSTLFKNARPLRVPSFLSAIVRRPLSKEPPR